MIAVVAERPGPPEVLRPVELPDPDPGPGEVRVAVEVAAVTFVETLVRAGSPVGRQVELPAVLGNGVGGRVDRVGAAVDPAWLGARVVTTTGGTGGYATLAIARAEDLHRPPEGVDLRTATALLADGRTAVGLLRAAEVAAGETVVVTAAAGGVGSLLVQLARDAGARVVGLVGSDAKRRVAGERGVDAVVRYDEPDWQEAVASVAPDGVDVVFDGVSGDVTARLFPLVRRGGRYVQHGVASGTWHELDATAAATRGVTRVPLSAVAAGGTYDLAEEAFALAARGVLVPLVGQTFPLTDAAAAHAAIAAREAVGKTLLVV